MREGVGRDFRSVEVNAELTYDMLFFWCTAVYLGNELNLRCSLEVARVRKGGKGRGFDLKILKILDTKRIAWAKVLRLVCVPFLCLSLAWSLFWLRTEWKCQYCLPNQLAQ